MSVGTAGLVVEVIYGVFVGIRYVQIWKAGRIRSVVEVGDIFGVKRLCKVGLLGVGSDIGAGTTGDC